MDRRSPGILFVHGIVGNNRIFQFLDPVVPKGAKVVRLTLAGHGGDALAFSRASVALWRSEVTSAVRILRRDCGRVIVVAHSMGCLFALREAIEGNCDGLLLINPALCIRLRRKMFVNVAKVAFGRTEGDIIASAALEAYGISIDMNPLHYYGWPMRYLEFFREVSRVRKMVNNSRITCETKVFIARNDEMVSTRSADNFRNQAMCEVVELPDSYHFYLAPDDCSVISGRFVSLLGGAR